MTKVLIASRIASALHYLQDCLKECSDFEVHPRLISNGHTDPLHGVAFQPDVVVLRFDTENIAELADWGAANPVSRPPLVVVGPSGETEAIRLAIRAGAKDFLTEPVAAGDLIATLLRVRDESRKLTQLSGSAGQVYAIVGAAGGAGASFVATNMARIMAGDAEHSGTRPPILVDLDLTFAPLSHYLDLHPDRGLLQALEVADSLDELALAGFGAKHRSGLRLLSTAGASAVLSRDVSADKLARLIDVLTHHHPQVIIDLPHVLDSLTATVFSLSSLVVVVLQQSLLQVRNAARLLQILKHELGVPPDRIRILVNRYEKNALVELADIRRSLNCATPLTIPSQYRNALESADSGVPLYDGDRNSPLARGIRQTVFALTGEDGAPRSSLLRRVFKITPGPES